MNNPPPRVVLPDTTARDAVIAALTGLLVLGFIVYGVLTFSADSNRGQSNMLTGTVVGREFTPAPEQQISVGGKGLHARQIDGEYVLKVQVGKEGRVYEVPVEKSVYGAKADGDPLTFLRPSSER